MSTESPVGFFEKTRLRMTRLYFLYFNDGYQKSGINYVFDSFEQRRNMNPAETASKVTPMSIAGIENIPPPDIPVVILCNHSDGAGAFLEPGVISYGVELARQGKAKTYLDPDRDKTKTAPRWIQAQTPKRLKGIKRAFQPIVNFVNTPVYRGVHATSDTLAVDREGKKDNRDSVIQIRGVLRNGGVIGLHPEANPANQLQEIDLRAKALIDLLSRIPNVQFIPAAAWRDKDLSFIKFGEPIQRIKGEDLGIKIMIEIAKLFPQSQERKRGFYAHAAEKRE